METSNVKKFCMVVEFISGGKCGSKAMECSLEDYNKYKKMMEESLKTLDGVMWVVQTKAVKYIPVRNIKSVTLMDMAEDTEEVPNDY